MFLIAVFRMAWLIFGSVEIFKSTLTSCEDYYVPCLVYVISQWAMIGLFLFVACVGELDLLSSISAAPALVFDFSLSYAACRVYVLGLLCHPFRPGLTWQRGHF
jgi:hypothetical protein